MVISKRYKKGTLKTRVIKNISEVPESEWNRIFPPVLEDYSFYRTMDESGFAQFLIFYILVYEKKTLVGAAPCFSLKYSLDTSLSGPLRHFSNAVKEFFPDIFSIKAVVCGMPIGEGEIGISGDSDKIIKAMVRRLEQIAKKTKSPVVAFKDFDSEYVDRLGILKKYGFIRLDSLPSSTMDIKFKNFEEYLKTISPASRYDFRRKIKKVDGMGDLKFEAVDSLDGENLAEVYGLYLQMVEKHEMGFELVPPEFFKNISKNMPHKTKFFLWKINGRLAAFVFALRSKDVFLDYYLGLDYAVAHDYHLYFIKFRDLLNWCIKNNIKRYDMGITGYEPKRRMGFRFYPLYLYVKLRNRFLRPAFNIFCQFLKFENFDPDLREIKKKG